MKLSQLKEQQTSGHSSEAIESKVQILERELAEHQERLNEFTNAKNAAEVQRLRQEMEQEYWHANGGEGSSGTAGEGEFSDVEDLESVEQRLVQELQRIDTACDRFVASGRVSREVIDNILTMLGEHMDEGHGRSNALVDHADSIHDFVFARISVHDAGLVPELLARLLAEEELDEVRERLRTAREERAVQEQPGLAEHGYTRDNAWMQQERAQWGTAEGGDGGDYHWYWNAVTGESQWETPVPGYWDTSQAWQATDEQEYEEAEYEQTELVQQESTSTSSVLPAVSGYEAEVLEFINGDAKSEESKEDDAKDTAQEDGEGEDSEEEWEEMMRRAKSAGVKPPTRAFGIGTNWRAWKRQCGSVCEARKIVVQAEQAAAIEEQHGGGRRRRRRRRKRQAKQAEAGVSGAGCAINGGVRDLPHEFFCPITLELMREPTLASDGHSYEREALEEWLAQADSSPMTGLPLPNLYVTPNLSLKQIIRDTVDQEGTGQKEDSDQRPQHRAPITCRGATGVSSDDKAQSKDGDSRENSAAAQGSGEEAEAKAGLTAKEEGEEEGGAREEGAVERSPDESKASAAKETETKQGASAADTALRELPAVAEVKMEHVPTRLVATTPMQLEEERQHLALTLQLQRAQQQQATQRQAAVEWEEQQKRKTPSTVAGEVPHAPPPQQLIRAASMPSMVPKKMKPLGSPSTRGGDAAAGDNGDMGNRGVHQTWTAADLREAQSARAKKNVAGVAGTLSHSGAGLTLTRPQLMVLRRKDPPAGAAAAAGVDAAAANPSSLRFLAGIVSRPVGTQDEEPCLLLAPPAARIEDAAGEECKGGESADYKQPEA
jgi:hypothetical protein